MQITQTIVTELINRIKTELGNGLDGAGIAIVDADKKVVSMAISEAGEREFLGLTDTKGSYFYIRLNGAPSESRPAAAQRYGSCGNEIIERVPLKLVAMHPCQDPAELLNAFKFALYNQCLKKFQSVYQIADIRLFPVTSDCVPWRVYVSETGNKWESLHSMMQFVSIDFILQYQYTYTEKCVDYKIC